MKTPIYLRSLGSEKPVSFDNILILNLFYYNLSCNLFSKAFLPVYERTENR